MQIHEQTHKKQKQNKNDTKRDDLECKRLYKQPKKSQHSQYNAKKYDRQ